MKLVVGLGNPGPRYRDTLHNIGFRVLDEIAQRHGLTFGSSPADALVARWRRPDADALFAKPLTYMNRSGPAVGELLRYYRLDPSDLLIVVDDAALPVGRLRARPDGSAGGHNGLKSVIEALGSSAFPRLRIGVGRGDPRRDLADHVLARPEAHDREVLDEAVVRAADAVELFVTDGIEPVMNRYNAQPQPGSRREPV